MTKKSFYFIALVALMMAAHTSCKKDEKDEKDEKEIPVTGVTLNSETLALKNGETKILTATVFPAEATNKTVLWTSNNTLVAAVDADGLVTGVTEGTATITATTVDGGKTVSCVVSVTNRIAFVRFKKEVVGREVRDMCLLLSAGMVNPIYYFYEEAGISQYFEIPPGYHIPYYEYYYSWADYGSDYCLAYPHTYNFQADRKYSVVYDGDTFYVADDGEI